MSNQTQVTFTNGGDFRATLNGHFIVKLEVRETSQTPWRETSPILSEEELRELNIEIFRLNNGLTEREARAQYQDAA